MKGGPLREFQVMVANGQLEAPFAIRELLSEVGDITFSEKIRIETNFISPFIGLLFLQRNSKVLDIGEGFLNIPFFSMQLKNKGGIHSNVIEAILNPGKTILQPGKRTTVWTISQIYTDDETTGLFQPSPLRRNDEDLLICPAFSKTQNSTHMVSMKISRGTPYTFRKGMNIANCSLLNLDQTKHIRLVNPISL